MHLLHYKPTVFRKYNKSGEALQHRVTAIGCFLYSMYYYYWPAPPCYCSWGIIPVMVEDAAREAQESFVPEKFI